MCQAGAVQCNIKREATAIYGWTSLTWMGTKQKKARTHDEELNVHAAVDAFARLLLVRMVLDGEAEVGLTDRLCSRRARHSQRRVSLSHSIERLYARARTHHLVKPSAHLMRSVRAVQQLRIRTRFCARLLPARAGCALARACVCP